MLNADFEQLLTATRAGELPDLELDYTPDQLHQLANELSQIEMRLTAENLERRTDILVQQAKIYLKLDNLVERYLVFKKLARLSNSSRYQFMAASRLRTILASARHDLSAQSFERVMTRMERILGQEPDEPGVYDLYLKALRDYYAHTLALCQSESYERALPGLQFLTSHDSYTENARLHCYLAIALLKMNKLNDALTSINCALNFDDEEPFFIKTRADIMLSMDNKQGFINDMIVWFDLLSNTSSPDIIAMHMIEVAYTYFEIGDRDKSIEYYNKALAIHPDVDDELMLEHIRLIGDELEQYWEEGQYEKAYELGLLIKRVNKNISNIDEALLYISQRIGALTDEIDGPARNTNKRVRANSEEDAEYHFVEESIVGLESPSESISAKDFISEFTKRLHQVKRPVDMNGKFKDNTLNDFEDECKKVFLQMADADVKRIQQEQLKFPRGHFNLEYRLSHIQNQMMEIFYEWRSQNLNKKMSSSSSSSSASLFHFLKNEEEKTKFDKCQEFIGAYQGRLSSKLKTKQLKVYSTSPMPDPIKRLTPSQKKRSHDSAHGLLTWKTPSTIRSGSSVNAFLPAQALISRSTSTPATSGINREAKEISLYDTKNHVRLTGMGSQVSLRILQEFAEKLRISFLENNLASSFTVNLSTRFDFAFQSFSVVEADIRLLIHKRLFLETLSDDVVVTRSNEDEVRLTLPAALLRSSALLNEENGVLLTTPNDGRLRAVGRFLPNGYS